MVPPKIVSEEPVSNISMRSKAKSSLNLLLVANLFQQIAPANLVMPIHVKSEQEFISVSSMSNKFYNLSNFLFILVLSEAKKFNILIILIYSIIIIS